MINFFRTTIMFGWEWLYQNLLFILKKDSLELHYPYLVTAMSKQERQQCIRLCPADALSEEREDLLIDLEKCSKCEYCLTVSDKLQPVDWQIVELPNKPINLQQVPQLKDA